MKKLFFFLLTISLSMLQITCKKTDRKDSEGNPLTNKVKLWFEKEYSKTKDYKDANSNGNFRKPYWSEGTSYNIDNIQVIEYPLLSNKKITYTTSQLTASQKRLIAQNSLLKIIFFVYPSGKIETRVIQYIPDFEFLATSNFNISKILFKDYAQTFKGDFLMYDLCFNLLVGYRFSNLGIKKISLIKKDQESLVNSTLVNGRTINCTNITYDPNCYYIQNLEYIESSCSGGWNIDEGFNPDFCTETFYFYCYAIFCTTDEQALSNCIYLQGNSPATCFCMLYMIGCPDPPPAP